MIGIPLRTNMVISGKLFGQSYRSCIYPQQLTLSESPLEELLSVHSNILHNRNNKVYFNKIPDVASFPSKASSSMYKVSTKNRDNC